MISETSIRPAAWLPLLVLVTLPPSAIATQFVDDPTRPITADPGPSLLVGRHLARMGLDRPEMGVLQRQDLSSVHVHQLGSTLATVSDWNGDCVADLAVAATGIEGDVELQYSNGKVRGRGSNARGFVWVIDARDGRVLRAWQGSQAFDRFGAAMCALDDLDADGAEELAISSPDGADSRGLVEVFSSRDGRRLLVIQGERSGDEFGACLTQVPDLDGDGKQDLAIGAPRGRGHSENSGFVEICSTRFGSRLARMEGPLGKNRFGQSLDASADLTGDGVRDLAVGAPDHTPGVGLERAGLIAIFTLDGRSTSVIEGRWLAQGLGVAIGALESGVEGKSCVELIAVSAASEPDFRMTGVVQLLTAPTFALRREFPSSRCYGTFDSEFGACLALLGDLDGDSVPEFAVGAPEFGVWNASTGAVFIHGGGPAGDDQVRHGSVKRWDEHIGRYGVSIARLPDLDDDGIDDYAVGSPDQLFAPHSTVEITSGREGATLRVLYSTLLPLP